MAGPPFEVSVFWGGLVDEFLNILYFDAMILPGNISGNEISEAKFEGDLANVDKGVVLLCATKVIDALFTDLLIPMVAMFIKKMLHGIKEKQTLLQVATKNISKFIYIPNLASFSGQEVMIVMQNGGEALIYIARKEPKAVFMIDVSEEMLFFDIYLVAVREYIVKHTNTLS